MTWQTLAVVCGAGSNVLALVIGLWKLSQISAHVQRTFDYFAREHEILIKDYCERHHIDIKNLPTRLPMAPWWGNK